VAVDVGEEQRHHFSGSRTVPVLVDGERIVADSGRIAAYLEETYPDRPYRASRLWRK
jgi:glutathione S-transferase